MYCACSLKARIHINLNPKLFGKLIAQKLHLKDASLNLSLLEVGDDEFQLLVENWDNVYSVQMENV